MQNSGLAEFIEFLVRIHRGELSRLRVNYSRSILEKSLTISNSFGFTTVLRENLRYDRKLAVTFSAVIQPRSPITSRTCYREIKLCSSCIRKLGADRSFNVITNQETRADLSDVALIDIFSRKFYSPIKLL